MKPQILSYPHQLQLPQDLEFITNDAEDVILMFDSTFLPIIAKLRPLIPTVKHYIIFTDAAHMPKEGILHLVLVNCTLHQHLLDLDAEMFAAVVLLDDF